MPRLFGFMVPQFTQARAGVSVLPAMAALSLPALGGPLNETLHVIAVFPRQAKEFSGVHVCGFGSDESLKSPTEVGALPWRQAVAFCRDPVVPQEFEHSLRCERGSAPAR
jgi:hypothetical protein